MKDIYALLAKNYDNFNAQIDYASWADFLEEIFAKYATNKEKKLLDLGAGTGSMSLALARRGYDVVGVDLSEDMLMVARERVYKENLQNPPLFLKQNMCRLDLYGTVDLAICCLDGINHLTTTKQLREAFASVRLFLEDDGLFVFDVNSSYKFEHIYADNSYVFEDDGIFCTWQNAYNKKTRLCHFYITTFEETEDGKYERFDAEQKEKMHTHRTLKKELEAAGFTLLSRVSRFDFSMQEEDERHYYIAKANKK